MLLFNEFKNKFTFEQRCIESNRVLAKYPDRVPIICERSKTAPSACPLIDKKKYLVPRDFTLGQYLFVVRKKLVLPKEKALFLFINNKIISSTQMIGDIYEKNKHSDGFLYVYYSYENVFG
jgi:GABA(A) receptor-associated protein